MTPFLEVPAAFMPAFCLTFLFSLLVSLYCLIAAVLYRAPARYIWLRGALLLACLFPLLVLTEGCMAAYLGEALSPITVFFMRTPAAVLALLLIAGIRTCVRLRGWRGAHISRMSIKESVDALPTGLCFSGEDGVPQFVNLRMNELCHALTGGALYSLDAFLRQLADDALTQTNDSMLVQAPDGMVWTFEHKRIDANGAIIRQLTASDTWGLYSRSRCSIY